MSTPISQDTIVSCHPDHLSAELDGELVIMSVTEGKYVGLNSIATVVWRRLGQPVRVAELCAELVRDYQGDEAVITQDVHDLLVRLQELGLLAIAQASE